MCSPRLLQATLFYNLSFLEVATAERVSELHVLDITRIRFTTVVHSELLTSGCAGISLPKINSQDNPTSVCPVCALRVYICRSKSLRGGQKCLFIPVFQTPTTEVSRNTI